jgi:MFS family permease
MNMTEIENHTHYTGETRPLLPRNPTKVEENNARARMYLNFGIIYTYASSGMALLTQGSSVYFLAEQIGYSENALGTLIIVCGVMRFSCNMASGFILAEFEPRMVAIIAQVITVGAMLWVPFVNSVWSLYLTFALISGCMGITLVCCVQIIRVVNREIAGPWLSSCSLMSYVGGLIPPILQAITGSLLIQFIVYAVLTLLSVACLATIDIESAKRITKTSSGTALVAIDTSPHYWVETSLACVMALSVSYTAITFFLESYADETYVLSSQNEASWLLLYYVMCTIFAILLSLGDLVFCHDETGNNFYIHLMVVVLISALGDLLVSIFPSSDAVLWLGTGLDGFGFGPVVSFCFEINNQLTSPTPMSSSILLFGISLSSLVIPSIISELWDYFDYPSMLFIVPTVAKILSVPLIIATPFLSYRRM